MTEKLCYRAADDMLVILAADGVTVLAETSASDMLARKTRDPEAAKVGLVRFLDFRDWQARTAGRVLWPGSVESAMTSAPRL